MQKLNIRLDKKRGQCYLIDENIVNFIIKQANLDSNNDIVLEIGSGLGNLSDFLVSQSKRAYLIENDKKIAEFLYSNFQPNYKTELLRNPSMETLSKISDQTKTIIIHSDVLTVPFPKVTKIIGNIPYQISGPIIFKILDSWRMNSMKNCILMVQEEFAKRLIGQVNSKNYSRISAAVGLFFKVRKIKVVPSSCFFPTPHVSSMIIELTAKKSLMIDSPENKYRKDYLSFLRGTFPYKNKSLRNALKFYFKNDAHAANYFKFIQDLLDNTSKYPFLKIKLRNFAPKQLFDLMYYGITGKYELLAEVESNAQ